MGWVALVINKSNFKEFELQNPDKHEVLAAVGSVKGIKGIFFALKPTSNQT